MQAIEKIKKASKNSAVSTSLLALMIIFIFWIATPIMEDMAGRPNINGIHFFKQLLYQSAPFSIAFILIFVNILMDLLVIYNVKNAKYTLYLMPINLLVILLIISIFWDNDFIIQNLFFASFFLYKIYKYHEYYFYYKDYKKNLW